MSFFCKKGINTLLTAEKKVLSEHIRYLYYFERELNTDEFCEKKVSDLFMLLLQVGSEDDQFSKIFQL